MNAPLKVAINFLPAPATGIYRYAKNLLGAMAEQAGLEVKAFSFGKRFEAPAWLPQRIPYRTTPLPGRMQIALQKLLPIETYLNLGHPDLVHSFEFQPLYTKAPFVLTAYDVAWRKMGKAYIPVMGELGIRLAEAAIAKAQHLCAISQAAADDLMAGGISAKQISITYLGVEETFWQVTAQQITQIREKYTLPEQFFLSTGALNSRKNIGALVQAFQSTPHQLVLAGPIPTEGIAPWALDQPNMRHLGYVSANELPALFAAATAYIFPSFLEGFGLPLIEAMAVNTPVIASDIAVFREIGQKAVLYFDPNDAQQLRQVIERLLASSDLQQELGEQGHTRARLFTWENCREATLNAYQHVLR